MIDDLSRVAHLHQPGESEGTASHVLDQTLDIFEDDHGRRCVLQRVRLAPASKCIQLVNEGIRDGILREVESNEWLERDDPVFDDRTGRLWAEEAKQGTDWVDWKGEALAITIPASPSSASSLLEEVMDTSMDWDDMRPVSLVVGIIRSLTSIEIKEDHIHLKFAPGEEDQLSVVFGGLTWDD